MLGTTRDTESDGQPSSNATGDGGDEDGVTFGVLTIGQTNTATVVVNGGAARLDAWIDFNRDGVFDAVTERITPAAGALLAVGANTLNFNIPAAALAGATFARFRLSTAGGLAPSGAASDGEVEDYSLTLSLPQSAGANGLDIFGRTASGQLWVGKNNGQTFANQLYGMFDPALGIHDVATADFNGDGLTDVIGRANSGEWLLARNTGSSFVNQSFGIWYEAVGWSDVVVGNFAGDALPDVIGRTAAGQWWLGVNTGAGFVNQLFGYWDATAGWRDVLTADFNGDGTMDVAGRTSTGQWWLGANHAGTLTNQPFGAWYEAAGWKDVAAADFNGDGRADIIGRTYTGGWWLGASTLAGLANSPFGQWNEAANWQDVLIGDFSGDGVPDVAGLTAGGDWWVGETNVGLGQLVNHLYGGWSFVQSGDPWRDVMQGDFNGDGRLDIIGRDATTGTWWLEANHGLYFFNTPHGAWDEAANWRDVHAGAFTRRRLARVGRPRRRARRPTAGRRNPSRPPPVTAPCEQRHRRRVRQFRARQSDVLAACLPTTSAAPHSCSGFPLLA